MPSNTGYKYFLFSASYMKERNEMEDKLGRRFVAGTVIVNSSRKEFSMISDTSDLNRYSDVRIIAEGYIETMKYTNPRVIRKRD